MPTSLKRIHHPTDFSPESEVAYHHALRLAVAAHAGLEILHVERSPRPREWQEFPCVGATLERWEMLPPGSYGSELAGVRVEKVAAHGKEPAPAILDHLALRPVDLVVLATHRRRGLDRWLHQEIAQKVSREQPVPTLFVPHGCRGFVSPDTGEVTLRDVLVPVDWMPSPQTAVDAAADLASTLGCEEATLTLFHASDRAEDMPPVEPVARRGWTWQRREAASVGVVEGILAAAGETGAGLIVMTTQGHDGFLDALRGSTTERVLRLAECPVLAVPASV